MNYRIIKRKIRQEEIDLVIENIRKTPFISAYSKKEWQNFKLLFVLEVNNKFAGVCAAIDIDKNWLEIGPMIILEEFRYRGFGRIFFRTTMNYLCTNIRKNIYGASRNPLTIKFMKDSGFILESCFWKLPWPIKYYILKLALNPLRIKEYLRKKFVYHNLDQWVYGLKYQG